LKFGEPRDIWGSFLVTAQRWEKRGESARKKERRENFKEERQKGNPRKEKKERREWGKKKFE
jgi:hypothetical protein